MYRFPYDLKKMRWILAFMSANILLFAFSRGDAENWQDIVYSFMPASLVLTSFLHFGFIHLLSNMYCMLIFGGVLCNCMSARKANGWTLPLLFLVASIVTGILPYCLQPDAYTAGASGTVYALQAYVFVVAFVGGSDPLAVALRQHRTWLIGNAILAVIWFFNTEVSFIGHFSGAVVGAIFAMVDVQRRRQMKRQNDMRNQQDGSDYLAP